MKHFFTILLALACVAGHAQDTTWHTLKSFRFEVKAGFGDIDKNESNKNVQSYAFMLSAQPDINLNDYISTGLHYTYFEAYNGHKQEVSRKTNHLVLASITLRSPSRYGKSWWYARVETGVNFYHNKVDTAFFPPHTANQTSYSGTGIALMPHGGFQFGRVTLDVAYLLSGNNGNHYGMLSLGYYFGGGKKS